jgi:N-formylglutamate deformylase
VIDVNRDPSGESLYPGQNTTGLCPLTDFDGLPLYRERAGTGRGRDGRRAPPTTRPTMPRCRPNWTASGRPTALRCFMIATRSGRISRFCSTARAARFQHRHQFRRTCAASIEAAATASAQAAADIRRCPQRPLQGRLDDAPLRPARDGLHAIQMELAQCTYCTNMRPGTMSRPAPTAHPRPSQVRSRNPVRLEVPDERPRKNTRDVYPADRPRAHAKSWLTEAPLADADEQPAPGCGREPA